MAEEEIKAKRLEIQKKRWESLGLTEGLQGGIIEKVRELFESTVKELKNENQSE